MQNVPFPLESETFCSLHKLDDLRIMSDILPVKNWNHKQVNGAEKKVFTFGFMFITEVNIVCKIREPIKFFLLLNFKSPFLIVVIIARLYLLKNLLVEDNASF